MPEESYSESNTLLAQEYQVLHKVAQALQGSDGIQTMLQHVLGAITSFEDLKVENKAGIFLVDTEKRVLRLFATFGKFSGEFLEKEKEVPFGDCLCGRVALSGDLIMSESCFTDPRHERAFTDMTAHGHYIVPLKSHEELIGVMFLYTNTQPRWYRHSQEVLLSIGALIADTIKRKQLDEELDQYRHHLEELVDNRTAELSLAKEQFQKLSHQIQTIREEEKARLSREVHDELGQSLTALKIDLQFTDKKLEPDHELKGQITEMIQLVDNTIKSVQRISMELRPPILDAFGLYDAITWQVEEYEKRMPVQFHLHLPDVPVELEKDLQTALFRIFQESVTNIVRHAQAENVFVEFRDEESAFVMTVRDDGIGISREAITHPDSLGLIGIQERVLHWKGRISFERLNPQGTRVTVRLEKENL